VIRGTTPRLFFTVPFDPAEAKKIWITFSQNEKEVFTVEKDACEYEGNTISVKLSQKQTLSLSAGSNVSIQIRVSFDGDGMDEALASGIITTSVQRILRDGEI
jgi:hypothetical protein